MLHRILDHWVDNPFYDWILAVLFALWANHEKIWQHIVISEHGAFYQTASSSALGLLSFGGVAVTLLVTVPQSERLKKALSQAGVSLISIMFQCLFGLIISTILFGALFAVDGSSQAAIRCALFVIAAVITSLCSSRILWLLQRILKLLI